MMSGETKKIFPLAPSHFAYFEISRTLLVLDQFSRSFPGQHIKLENLMLVDFGVQYPRVAAIILENLEKILKSNDESEEDISDLFAREKVENINEKFAFIISSLIARGLVEVKLPEKDDLATYIVISAFGRETANRFSSRFSFYVRELAEIILKSWHKSNSTNLMKNLFENIPENYSERMSLTKPFVIWDEDRVEE